MSDHEPPKAKERELLPARVDGLWLIVECPHCHRPNVVNKYVVQNMLYSLFDVKTYTCRVCGGAYQIKLELKETW